MPHRILIVDDAPDILRTNKRFLAPRGYEADTADTPAEALACCGRIATPASCWT